MGTNWKFIFLYILLAFGISVPTHLGLFDKTFQQLTLGFLISNWTYLAAGVGPMLAGVILLILHEDTSDRITILGDAPVKNLLVAVLPVITFFIFGLENDQEINQHYFGFLYASIHVVYAFMEEFGWRRYLQNALEGINKHWKYMLIGLIWWFWHFRFESQFDLFVFPAICIGGGYLLGSLADQMNSILPVVMFHTLIILLTNSGGVTMGKIVPFLFTIVVWFAIEKLILQPRSGPGSDLAKRHRS